MDSRPPTSDVTRVAVAFASATLIWGSTFLVIRISNDALPPLWAATLRLALAALLLVTIATVTRQGLPTGPARRAAAAYGFFLFGLNMPLLYWGETVVPSGLAALVFATGPITNALVARAFGIERLDRPKLGAACVALAGVAVLFARELSARVTALPVAAIFLATVAAAFGTVLLKRGPRQSPIGTNAIATMVGAPVCLALSFLAHEAHPLPRHAAQIVPLVYLTIAGSVGAFVIVSWLVHRVDVITVGFIGVVVPVIAIVLGVVIRHEPFAREQLLGSLLVLAGVVLALASDRRRAARARSAAGSEDS
ncbi:MAG: EamA family transporter [Candidatus Eisenbacteria bacterium]|uniref:EamA family transporter n=1 Tax=Eiseniibacteriota bacterium TaxID=2212470 RepID=A0A9D6L8Y2_UNCEI|nr:EamA family transporter [Candidatus Eisenbacteria bacterium]MBI3539125.1 EamA family transporter [Candidatus Eisenbacteria bacterium]